MANDFITFVDTIEHMSLVEIGAITRGLPFGAYMSSPRSAAGVVSDGRYCFTGVETFRWEVYGGKTYEHGTYEIPDQFVLEWSVNEHLRGAGGGYGLLHWLTARKRTTLYQSMIYRQPDCMDRMVFVAIPMATFDVGAKELRATLASYGRQVELPTFTRMRVDLVGSAVVRGVLDDGAANVSLAWKGDVTGFSVSIPSEAWAALRDAAKDKSFQHSDVQRMLTSIDKNSRYNQAELRLVSAAVAASDGPRHLVNYTVIAGCSGLVAGEIGTNVAEIAAPPLVAPAVAASKSESNRVASGQLRLKTLLNKHSLPFELRGYAAEFVSCLVDSAGEGVPVDLDEVFAVQNSGAQKARQKQASGKVEHVLKANAFQKAEAGDAGIPRNIVQLSQGPNQRLAQFVYAFKRDVLATAGWFYPGLTPKQTCERLAEWMERLEMPEDGLPAHGEGDFAKLDATVSADIRSHVLHAAMLRWVHPDFELELSELLQAEVDLKVYFTAELTVSPKGAILSGSGNTSVFGTIVNAFVQFVAKRRAGKSPASAYAAIDVCYGDDSVLEHGPDYVKAASDMGMKLEYARSECHGRFSFLARTFAPIETIGSVPHLVRRLSKLPVVTQKASGAHKWKVLGHMAVDGNVPVLSEYLSALARIGGYGSARPKSELYDGKGDVCWMVQQGPYPIDGAYEAFAIECACNELGLTSADVAKLRANLARCDTAEQLEQLYLEHLGAGKAPKLPVVFH